MKIIVNSFYVCFQAVSNIQLEHTIQMTLHLSGLCTDHYLPLLIPVVIECPPSAKGVHRIASNVFILPVSYFHHQEPAKNFL